jgi:hypothetical protein
MKRKPSAQLAFDLPDQPAATVTVERPAPPSPRRTNKRATVEPVIGDVIRFAPWNRPLDEGLPELEWVCVALYEDFGRCMLVEGDVPPEYMYLSPTPTAHGRFGLDVGYPEYQGKVYWRIVGHRDGVKEFEFRRKGGAPDEDNDLFADEDFDDEEGA